MVSIFGSRPSYPGFDSQHSQNLSEEKLLLLLRLISGAAQRKVNSGLKMLIEPIQYWQVPSQYCKKSLQTKEYFSFIFATNETAVDVKLTQVGCQPFKTAASSQDLAVWGMSSHPGRSMPMFGLGTSNPGVRGPKNGVPGSLQPTQCISGKTSSNKS